MADEVVEKEAKEPTQEENIQSAIDEALGADGLAIEDDTVDEETGELNALKGEAKETNETDGDKPKEPVTTQKDTQQEPPKTDSEEVETDVTGKRLQVKDGALIDPDTQKVVANAGRERRFYEQRELARSQVQEAQTQLQQSTQRAEAAEQKAKVFEDAAKATYGVQPDEVKIGVDLVKGFQSDPTGTLKKLLAEALSKGYKIEGITTGMDALIAQELSKNSVDTQQTDPTVDAANEVEQFYGRRPDAKLHDGLLAQVVNGNPNISLDDAYYALRDSFISKGFDWNVPIEQQIKTNPQPQQQQQKQLPNGGGVVTDTNVVDINKQASSPSNQSLDDIIRDSMKEQGLG